MAFKLGSSIYKKNLKVYYDPANPKTIPPIGGGAFEIPTPHPALVIDAMGAMDFPIWETPPVYSNMVGSYLHAYPYHISKYDVSEGGDGYHANPHYRKLNVKSESSDFIKLVKELGEFSLSKRKEIFEMTNEKHNVSNWKKQFEDIFSKRIKDKTMNKSSRNTLEVCMGGI